MKTGRLRPAMPGLELLQSQRPAGMQIVEPAEGFLKKVDMDVLSFEAVIVIEALRVDQRSAAFPVPRDDLLSAALSHLVTERGQTGTRMTE